MQKRVEVYILYMHIYSYFRNILYLDEHLPKYYKIIFVYGIHSLLNLVDSFLLNLARPETKPIWGLIGIESMNLEDFQYLGNVNHKLYFKCLNLGRGIIRRVSFETPRTHDPPT